MRMPCHGDSAIVDRSASQWRAVMRIDLVLYFICLCERLVLRLLSSHRLYVSIHMQYTLTYPVLSSTVPYHPTRQQGLPRRQSSPFPIRHHLGPLPETSRLLVCFVNLVPTQYVC